MKVRFRTRKLEKCYFKSNQSVRSFGMQVARKYVQRVDLLKAVENLDDLSTLPGLRFHSLNGKRQGQYAINLTGFYRLIFTMEGEYLDVVMVEEVSKHYDD